MISSKKLCKMASKWENLAVIKRWGISLPRNEASDGDSYITSMVAHKGHFVVYTADQKRFSIPLVHLNKSIYRELLKLAEEFGFEFNGPSTLPCDASFMEYILFLIERVAAKDIEKALLMPVDSDYCPPLSLFHEQRKNQKAVLCSN